MAKTVKKTEAAKASPKPAAKKSKTTAPGASKATAAKDKKPSTRKAPAAKKPAKAAKTLTKPASKTIPHEEIALRAYFIAENRHRQGIQSDSAHDWLEAERQLYSERIAVSRS